MKQIIFSEDCYKHPNRDKTWKLTDYEIEDKIKELKKEIYQLQNSRKKQPNLLVFRKENLGSGEMRCHIFTGFQIRDEEKRYICADSWHPINKSEKEYVLKKFNLTDKAKKVINETS